ncbi:PIN domain-containing protein [Rhizobium sp. BR 315]|uniref:PIN domain-containing protein n=1 Tax=Rhizobium sp. BR 315 TaxID=3040014 RepID=UPI003D33530A
MGMAFILDTSVLSETSKSRPDPNVVRFLQEADDLNIPAGVIMEISLGISLICGRNPSKAVKLSEWYQRLLNSGLKIINTDTRIAETWGTLLSARDLWSLMFLSVGSERVKGGQDLHIAAAALIHRLPIASLNPKDFLRIHRVFPIPGLYDPRSDTWHVRPISVADISPKRVRLTEVVRCSENR